MQAKQTKKKEEAEAEAKKWFAPHSFWELRVCCVLAFLDGVWCPVQIVRNCYMIVDL